MPHNIPDQYIGDGVYASFDGFQIWLRTQRDGMTHKIAIDPLTLDGLNKYHHFILETIKNHE